MLIFSSCCHNTRLKKWKGPKSNYCKAPGLLHAVSCYYCKTSFIAQNLFHGETMDSVRFSCRIPACARFPAIRGKESCCSCRPLYTPIELSFSQVYSHRSSFASAEAKNFQKLHISGAKFREVFGKREYSTSLQKSGLPTGFFFASASRRRSQANPKEKTASAKSAKQMKPGRNAEIWPPNRTFPSSPGNRRRRLRNYLCRK